MTSTKRSPTQKVRLTEKMVRDLPLPKDKSQVFYRDDQCKGLFLGIGKGGSRSFYFYRKINNKPERILLGHYPEMTLEHARKEADKRRNQINHGGNPANDLRAARAEITLDQAFHLYMEKHGNEKKTGKVMERDWKTYSGELKPPVRKNKETGVEELIKPIPKKSIRLFLALRDKQLSKITRVETTDLHKTFLAERGLYAANRAIQLLRAVFNKAIDLEQTVTAKNPFKIKLPAEKPRDRFLKNDEVRRLFDVLDTKTGDVRDFVLLALFTGARRKSLLSMRWEDIDFDERTITFKNTKNELDYVAALNAPEIAILKEREKLKTDDSEFVFPGIGESGHLEDPKRSWQRIRKDANLEDITIHDLRRSLAASMASANVNVAIIKGALGHKDLRTTLKVYAHTHAGAQRDAKALVQGIWQQKRNKAGAKKSAPTTEPDKTKKKTTREVSR